MNLAHTTLSLAHRPTGTRNTVHRLDVTRSSDLTLVKVDTPTDDCERPIKFERVGTHRWSPASRTDKGDWDEMCRNFLGDDWTELRQMAIDNAVNTLHNMAYSLPMA